MANNKKQNNNTPAAKAQPSAKGGVAAIKGLKGKNLAIAITAAVLALIFIIGVVFIVIDSLNRHEDENFDYLTSDLSKYITMDAKNYKDYKVSLQVAKPHDIDVDVTILNLLYSKRGEPVDGKSYSSGKITAGDKVSIYYRGYLKDKDGKEEFVDNMCNFANAAAADLEIGSNSFVPGFELDLVGTEFTSANQFVKITEGKPKDGQILYISYTKQLKGSTGNNDKTTVTAERIILDTDDIDKKYGTGFEERLRGLNIKGDGVAFESTIDGKTYNFTDVKIDFATECEKEGTYFVVECYFPYDYQTTTLQNRTAYFEVYVNGIIEYEAPEFNDKFIEENLGKDDFGVTKEDLDEYEGSYTEKMRAFIKDLLDEDYKEAYESALEEAMWNHYHNENVAVVKKYPKKKVEAIYNEYYNDVIYQYEQSGGTITNALGSSTTCDSIDEYAVIYLGLEYSENKDWKGTLYSMSESLVKERLVLYYIMRAENLVPTPAALNEQVTASKQEYLDEYIDQYLAEYKDKKENYDDAGWKEFVEERKSELYEYYDDAYFTEIAYYEIALEEFLKWPNVTTLDDTTVSDK